MNVEAVGKGLAGVFAVVGIMYFVLYLDYRKEYEIELMAKDGAVEAIQSFNEKDYQFYLVWYRYKENDEDRGRWKIYGEENINPEVFESYKDREEFTLTKAMTITQEHEKIKGKAIRFSRSYNLKMAELLAKKG